MLLGGLLAGKTVIELRDQNIYASAIGEIYSELILSHPELFHVELHFSYAYRDTPAGRVVTAVYPAYSLSGEALAASRTAYIEGIAAILAAKEAALGPSPAEADTLLFFHDYLADRCAYDTRPTEEGAPNRDAYTLLRDGMGVCQAYALALLALCRAAGLEADVVTSRVMDHAWNHVRVNGSWYHVDITRDDPVTLAGEETVRHERLLRSDAGMAALGYHGYTCPAGHACTDERYEIAGRLAVYSEALCPLRVGDGLVIWLGTVEEAGQPLPFRLTEAGLLSHAAGDTNGDGVLTPADLLLLSDPALPECYRAWLRRALVSLKTEW